MSRRDLPGALLAELLRPGTAVLHACAIAVDGRAHIFLGGPGAGKSTLAALAAASGRAELLDDEIVPVRPGRAGLRVEGSPFWGGRRDSLPLAGVYGLGRARKPVLAPGKPADLEQLFRACCLNFSRDAAHTAALLRTGRLLATAWRGTLRFPPRGSAFLDLLR